MHLSDCLYVQSKEERILELETENALLHLRLAEVRTDIFSIKMHLTMLIEVDPPLWLEV